MTAPEYLDPVRHELHQLRTTLAMADKWVDLLIEGIENDCDPCEGICHGFDVIGDGTCALVADLNRLRAILADKEPTP